VWLIGAMVCLPAVPWVQLSVSAGNGWPHNALRHHWLMPISCKFRDYKALLVTSLTHVSGAIASVQTFMTAYGRPRLHSIAPQQSDLEFDDSQMTMNIFKIQDGGRPPFLKDRFLAITQQPIARFQRQFANQRRHLAYRTKPN